jgi:hypothetical protein
MQANREKIEQIEADFDKEKNLSGAQKNDLEGLLASSAASAELKKRAENLLDGTYEDKKKKKKKK